jgi:hypothetical protein
MSATGPPTFLMGPTTELGRGISVTPTGERPRKHRRTRLSCCAEYIRDKSSRTSAVAAVLR